MVLGSLALGALAVAAANADGLAALWGGYSDPASWAALGWAGLGPGALASYLHVMVSFGSCVSLFNQLCCKESARCLRQPTQRGSTHTCYQSCLLSSQLVPAGRLCALATPAVPCLHRPPRPPAIPAAAAGKPDPTAPAASRIHSCRARSTWHRRRPRSFSAPSHSGRRAWPGCCWVERSLGP